MLAVTTGIKSDEIKQMIESDSQYVQVEKFADWECKITCSA